MTKMLYRLINNLEELKDPELTKENLRFSNQTGHCKTIRKDPRTRRVITEYRHGMVTPIGNIEESVWKEAVLRVVQKRNDQPLFDALLSHYQNDPSPALRKDYKYWAFRAYVSELYNNPKWAGYKEFHENYYGGVIKENEEADG